MLDGYIYGFIQTELNLPFQTSEETQALAQAIVNSMPQGAYPHLVEFTRQHVMTPGYSYGNEFEFGLELILDGLARAHRRERTG